MQYDLGRISRVGPPNSDNVSAVHTNGESVLAGDEPLGASERSRASLRPKFKEFIGSYRSETCATVLKYKLQLHSNLFRGRNFLEVKWEHIAKFSEDLGTALRSRAPQTIILFEEVLREIAEEEQFYQPNHQSKDVRQLQVL